MHINSEGSTVTPALGGPQPILTSKEDFFKCCLKLLKNHGGQVPMSKFQQYFQTEFHISPKVSDYGASTMKELLLQCPSIMVRHFTHCLVDCLFMFILWWGFRH